MNFIREYTSTAVLGLFVTFAAIVGVAVLIADNLEEAILLALLLTVLKAGPVVGLTSLAVTAIRRWLRKGDSVQSPKPVE